LSISIRVGVDVGDLVPAACGARTTMPELRGDVLLHAGGHDRRLGDQQRHGLPLHVRAHQRAVGVVVLQERDQRRPRRRPSGSGHVDVLTCSGVDDLEVAGAGDHRAALALRRPASVRRPGVGRGEVGLGFLVGPQPDDLVGQLALLDLARYGVIRKPYSSTPA
jgi:hypothetical protein